MTNNTWIYSNIVSIKLYIRNKCTSNYKYAFKGDFGILSQGHALNISGYLTDSGSTNVQISHKCKQSS